MDKTTTPVSETGHSAWTTYWRETRRPVVSLAFVVPMLVVYEAGILWLGPQAMRNGADVWLRQFLDATGFGQYFLLPVLTVSALLAWHHLTRDPWRFRSKMLYSMLAESAAFGVLLLLLAHLQGRVLYLVGLESTTAIPPPECMTAGLGRLIGYCGAGIYEELLFRMLLLPLVAGWIRGIGASRIVSLVSACVITSVIFSTAHYSLFTSVGEPFDWFSFSFRILAGIFFAALFIHRGFGIAAGSHTLYDVFAAIS